MSEKTRHEALICDKLNLPPVRSRAWRSMVDYRLLAGWGVEDIAIQLHCRPELVREYARDLHANGVFSKWWSKVRANA